MEGERKTGTGREADKELQEKVFAYRVIEARLQALAKERDVIMSKIFETRTTIASIDEATKSKNNGEIVFHIGSDTYMVGKVSDKGRIIIEVGGNVAMEKTPEEAKKFLNGRIGDLEASLSELNREMSQAFSAMDELAPEIQRMMGEQPGSQ